MQALHEMSRDITCTHEVSLTDGRRVNAVQLQWEYLEHAKKYVEREDDTPEHREVLERWEAGARRARDRPALAAPRTRLGGEAPGAEAYRERDGLDWNDPKLRAIDLQYHDVRRDKGLYYRLEAGGKVERLTTDDEVETRRSWSRPMDTRAYFRGRCIDKYPDAIAAASWDSLIVDTGADALQRIPMREPLRGTKAHVEDLLAACDDAASLVATLQG